MLTPGMGDWGLGIALRTVGGDLRFWHNGVNEGFRAILMSHPNRRQAIVIMANGEQGNAVLGPARVAIGRVLGWADSELRTLTPVAVTRESRVEQVGHYSNGTLSAHVGLTEDGLIVVTNRGDPFEAIPQGQDVYAVAQAGERLTFERDPASGRITGVSLERLTLPRRD